MEYRLQDRFQVPADHLLGDAIGHRWYAQRPRPVMALRDVHPTHRRRHVAAGRQSVPELVEVGGEPHLEVLDRLSVYPSRSLAGLHALEGFPDLPLRDGERLCLVSCGSSRHRLAAAAGWMPRPLWSGTITVPSTLLRAVLPLCPASVLWASRGSPARPSPLASGRQVLLFHVRAWRKVTPPTSRTPRGPVFRAPPVLIPGWLLPPVLTSTIPSRQLIGGSLPLVSLHLT